MTNPIKKVTIKNDIITKDELIISPVINDTNHKTLEITEKKQTKTQNKAQKISLNKIIQQKTK